MQRQYPHLSNPIILGRTTFRNHMLSAPMGGTDIANDGGIGTKSTVFYELRGKGGAASTRAAPSTPSSGARWRMMRSSRP